MQQMTLLAMTVILALLVILVRVDSVLVLQWFAVQQLVPMLECV